jgi:hypothetical protein
MVRRPGFTPVVVLTRAVGIGANEVPLEPGDSSASSTATRGGAACAGDAPRGRAIRDG